jgi:hypothetical protein
VVFFKTPEVKVLFAAMEAVAPAFAQNLAFDEVRKRAEKTITDNPDSARRALIEENRTAREVCLTTLVNIVRQDLLSGDERHIGGMLTLIGQQRQAIYSIALRELVAIGYLTEEDRKLTEQEFRREQKERFS